MRRRVGSENAANLSLTDLDAAREAIEPIIVARLYSLMRI